MTFPKPLFFIFKLRITCDECKATGLIGIPRSSLNKHIVDFTSIVEHRPNCTVTKG